MTICMHQIIHVSGVKNVLITFIKIKMEILYIKILKYYHYLYTQIILKNYIYIYIYINAPVKQNICYIYIYYLFIYLFIYSFIYLFIYLFI